MSLAIKVENVIGVLLADGWHKCELLKNGRSSFDTDAYEYLEGDRLLGRRRTGCRSSKHRRDVDGKRRDADRCATHGCACGQAAPAQKGEAMTPVMAAGVTDRLWDVSDLVALLETSEPKKAA